MARSVLTTIVISIHWYRWLFCFLFLLNEVWNYFFVGVKDDFVAVKDDFVGVKDDSVAVKDDFVAVQDDFVAAKYDFVSVNNTNKERSKQNLILLSNNTEY